MADSTSSASRSRPVIAILTASAAAFVTYLIFNSVNKHSTSGGLQRRRAVRKPNPRRHQNTPADLAEPPVATASAPPALAPDNEQSLHSITYHIAMENAIRNGTIHRQVSCSACHKTPIRGIRWHCANCPDYDLCSACEAIGAHDPSHIFYKIRIPAPNLKLPPQTPLYPGNINPPITLIPPHVNQLHRATGKSMEEIGALWLTYNSLVTRPDVGLDKDDFNRSFQPRYSSFVSAPNLVFDRLFVLFHPGPNNTVGFPDFLRTLAAFQSDDPITQGTLVFLGYDMDDDGYITRDDVLRIFRSNYTLAKEASRNHMSEISSELMRRAEPVIESNRALSSTFTATPTPTGNPANTRQPAWSDYEIPDAGEDFGQDVFYQESEKRFQELLDPIFLAKETGAEGKGAGASGRPRGSISEDELWTLWEEGKFRFLDVWSQFVKY